MVDNAINSKLQNLLNNFIALQKIYNALKIENKSLRDLLRIQQLKTTKENKTISTLKESYNSFINHILEEHDKLYRNLSNAQEECEYLRHIRMINEKEISRLQDELEVTRAQIDLRNETYSQTILEIEEKHKREIENYKSVISNLHEKIGKVANFSTPKKQLGKRKKMKICVSKEKVGSFFKWPALNIVKSEETSQNYENNGFEIPKVGNDTTKAVTGLADQVSEENEDTVKIPRKKKKLFFDDKEEIVDI